MGIWNSICGWFSADSNSTDCGCDINPATGLPMINDCCGVDVGGSPFGMDIHHDDCCTSSADISDDSWATSFSSWDD
jgi:hypothetical protein